MAAEAIPRFGIPKRGIFGGFLSPTRTQADAQPAALFFLTDSVLSRKGRGKRQNKQGDNV